MNKNIFWFRRDLRLKDNAGLYHALKTGIPTQCIFIFDKEILSKLPKSDPRVSFIHQTLLDLQAELEGLGSNLKIYFGDPIKIWRKILREENPSSVYLNKDYEPYAKERDGKVENICVKQKVHFISFKDHIIFEKEEVCKADGLPYTVFSPYKRKWLEKLKTKMSTVSLSYFFKPYPTLKYSSNLIQGTEGTSVPLSKMGFIKSAQKIPSKSVKQSVIKKYEEQRNFPAIEGTSRLGIHFRFGTISIREKAKKAQSLNDTFLSELIWRDFYAQILDSFPHVVEGAFRPKYDKVEWRFDEIEFEAWQSGKTGYPLVDAGMRELNNTGFMHNRVRMVVASFLTKHLLMHWSLGEAYFAEKLLDFDLASNSGGWQWASGSGTDAAPYFRIFNPTSQLTKFDKDFTYVKRWVPEFGTDDYPEPIVDHKFARERCLSTYKSALSLI